MQVDYITHSGDDLLVCNAARVSFDKESSWAEKFGAEPGSRTHLNERDEKLIKYLAKHNHWSPFSHPQITLRMKAPIFIRTQCFKSKVGFTENEVSRRYVDDEPEFFIPVPRKRSPSAKQGSLDEFPTYLDECLSILDTSYMLSKIAYEKLLKHGVCPEQARMVLPQGMYTQWFWTGSLAAYARFYKQRTDPHAQKEIRDLAKMVGDVIEPLFPNSWKVLTESTNDTN